mgnify:FL=1
MPEVQRDVAPLIWEALGDLRMTTGQIASALESMFGYRCPDDLAKTMTKLKRRGLVKGQVSMEHGGWIWWADDDCRAAVGEDMR